MRIGAGFIFCLLLFPASGLPVSAESWVSLGSSPGGSMGVSSEKFIDMDSVKRSGNRVKYNAKTVFENETMNAGGVILIRHFSTIIIKCSERTHAIVARSSFDRRGNKTSSLVDSAHKSGKPPPPSRFEPILPGSAGDFALRRLCR